MNSKVILNLIVMFLLVVNIGILSYFYFNVFKLEGSQCLNDPLVYGYNQLKQINQEELYCSCNLLSVGSSPSLIFDSSGRRFSSIIGSESSPEYPDWSEFSSIKSVSE